MSSTAPSSAPPGPRVGGREPQWYDVVVVGAGPAGALAARQAALGGLSVLLVDRVEFPRRKVCGSCLHPRGSRALKRAGLGELVQELGGRAMTQMVLGVRGRQLELPLQGVRAISRWSFDAALVEAARGAGAATCFGRVAQLQEPGPEREFRTLDLMRVAGNGETGSFPLVPERPESVRTRCVVAADGLGGALLAGAGETPQDVMPASRIGFGATLEAGGHDQRVDRMHLSVGREGYVGSVVLEDGRLDLAGAVDPQAMAQLGMPRLVASLLAQAGARPPAGLDDAHWSVTPALTRRAKGFNDHPLGASRAFAIGDAAGYVEPFTGEGMAWALQSALSVQPLLRRAVDGWSEGLGLEWARVHEEQFGARRRACRRVARLTRSPRLLSAAAMLLGRSRSARGFMARVGYGAGPDPDRRSQLQARSRA